MKLKIPEVVERFARYQTPPATEAREIHIVLDACNDKAYPRSCCSPHRMGTRTRR